MESKTPSVFIHYSWDNEKHKQWILFLADRLLSDGVRIIIDRYDLKLGSNNNYFMEKIQFANKVLLIMTPKYKVKADKRISGVGYEYQIITSEFINNISSNTKFIPILRRGNKKSSIPNFLQSFFYHDMTLDNKFEIRYLELLKTIYDEPILEKPKRGKKPDFKNLNKKIDSASRIKIETNYNKILELGLTKSQSHKILGKPQDEGALVETYWSHGLQLYYNRHSMHVDGVLAKKQPSGVSFEGDILGVRLGETFAEIKSKIGNPLNWGLPDPYTAFAFYKIENRFLTIAIWRNKPKENVAGFKEGTAYVIGYCETYCLLACEAIVAVTIEEIRSGKKPTHFEKKPKEYDIDFNASFFSEPYLIIPTQFGPFGGYYVGVYFEKSDVYLDFWLYDLMWSYLVIRMIKIRQKDD